MAHRISILILAVALLCHGVQAGGSVFTGNGVGEQTVGGGTRALGLAGGAFGLADSTGFNTQNPALAAFATRTVFRMSGQLAFWTTTADGRQDADAEFVWKDLCIYLPVTRTWRLGLGAEPTRYANLETFANRTVAFVSENESDIVQYEERNEWQNGTVDLRVDNALRLTPRLGVGVSAIYTLGRNERRRTLDFPEAISYSYYFDAAYHEVETFRGWSAALGVYYAPTSRLGLGLAFRPRSSGDWTYEFTKTNSDSVVKRERRGDSPGDLKLGVSWHFDQRWVSAADVNTGFWSRGDEGIMADLARLPTPENPLAVSAGIERLAGHSPLATGLNLWGYRGGLYYRKHYWSYRNGATVEDIGMTLGLSLPLSASQGWLHWTVEAGNRGLDEEKLGATETFFRTSLQLEMSESWFQRTRPRRPQ